MSLMFKKAEIVSFTRDLLETFEQQTRVKKLDLKFHTSAPEIEMWIDPKNFDKIILNLLSNACKFTPENGQVEISLSTGEDTHLPKMHPCADMLNLQLRTVGCTHGVMLFHLFGNGTQNNGTVTSVVPPDTVRRNLPEAFPSTPRVARLSGVAS